MCAKGTPFEERQRKKVGRPRGSTPRFRKRIKEWEWKEWRDTGKRTVMGDRTQTLITRDQIPS